MRPKLSLQRILGSLARAWIGATPPRGGYCEADRFQVRAARGPLLAEAVRLQDRAVADDVLALDVGQKATAAADELEQAAAAVVILLVRLEVLGQLNDSFGQQSDLDFRRAGVVAVQAMVGDDFCFFVCVKRHIYFSLFLRPSIGGGPYRWRFGSVKQKAPAQRAARQLG